MVTLGNGEAGAWKILWLVSWSPSWAPHGVLAVETGAGEVLVGKTPSGEREEGGDQRYAELASWACGLCGRRSGKD